MNLEPICRQIILILAHLLQIEYNLPQFFQIFSIIFTIVQPMSYIFYFHNEREDQLRNSLTKITIVTRLYIYIEDENIMSALFWTIVAIQNLILFTAVVLAYRNRHSYGSSAKRGRILSLLFSLYVYVISSTFFPTILEICFFNALTVAGFCLSILMIIETILIVQLGERIFKRGLTLKSTSLLYINITVYSYFIHFFKIVQIIVFFYLKVDAAQIVQSLLNIIIQICFIAEQLYSRVYALQIYSNTIIIFSSIGVILSLDVIFTSTTTNHNYWILLSLILIKILYDQDQKLPYSLSKFQMHQLKYLYVKLDLSNPEKTACKLFVFQLYKSHTILCQKKLMCTCSQYKNKQYKGLLKLIEEMIEVITYGKSKTSRDYFYLDYSQILLRRQQYVKAQQHIERSLQLSSSLYGKQNHEPLSKVTVILLEFLKEQVLNEVLIQITEKIILTNISNKSLTDSLRQFVINENSDQQIIQRMKKTIQSKIQFYYSFIEHQNVQHGNINYAIEYIESIAEFREVLTKRYEEFPSNYPILMLATSNQNILKYFELHILNDYIESFNTNKGKALEDDKYNLISGQLYNKIFGLNPAYFITEFNLELDIIITKSSNKAQELLQMWKGCHNKEQKYELSLELSQYLPEYIILKHRQLVEQFLDDGKNKYYQQQDLAFLKLSDKIMLPIQVMLSLNSSVSDKFSFIAFFYECQDYRSYLVVDQKLEIINVSQNLQETMFYNEHKGSKSVVTIIPNFEQFVKSSQNYFFNVEIKLAKESQHHSSTQSFTGNVSVFNKYENQFQCYFVELDNVRQIQRRQKEDGSSLRHMSTSLFQNSAQKINQINTELEQSFEKMIPYEDEQQLKKKDSFCLITKEKYQYELIDPADTNNVCTQQLVEYYKGQIQIEPNSQRKLISGNFSHDEDMKKQVNNVQENEEFDDGASCSSLSAIRKSKYYKKFEIITILMRSEKSSQKIRKMNGYISIYIAISITGLIMFITMIEHLQQFVQDIQILSVRYQVLEPYEAFYVSRFSQVNYREQLGWGYINASQYAQLTKFPFATFELMFNHLRDSMYAVIQMGEIDQLSENLTFSIYFLNNSYNGYTTNVTIRSLIGVVINYQYDFYLGLTVKSVAFDSPFFYFTTKNYLIIKHTFDGLNDVVLDSTLLRSALEKQSWLAVLLPFLIFSVILSILIIHQYQKYNAIMNHIFLYLMELDQLILDSEKQRLQQHINIINTQISKVKQFYFDVDEIDVELEQCNCNSKQIKKQQKPQNVVNHQFQFGAIIMVSHVVLQITFFVIIYIIIQTYFHKYDLTSVVYQRISDLGVDIPTIYAQREVLFRRQLRYSFLSDAEIDGVYAVLFKAYNNVQQFQFDNYDLSSQDYLFNEASVAFYAAINKGNLCDYQTSQFASLSTTVCTVAMQGNLQHGLSQIIPYILSTIKSQQYDTKNFTIQPTNTRLELEGATILGNVMSTVISELYQNLLNSCQFLMLYTQLACILYLIFQCFTFLFYIIVINQNFTRQFQSIKQSIFLFPRQTLIFDDQFYRYFRSIIKDEGIQQ